jgi:hypothetical protein
VTGYGHFFIVYSNPFKQQAKPRWSTPNLSAKNKGGEIIETENDSPVSDPHQRRDSDSRKRNAHASSTHLKQMIRTFLRGLADFKWVYLIGLFTADIIFVVVPGMVLFLTQPFLWNYAYMATYFCGTQSPLIYLIWRRIQHDDSLAKVMTEAYEQPKDESGQPKTTAALVDEYQRLLPKKEP